MIDSQTPFVTMQVEHVDFSPQDVEAECLKLFQRQKAIALLLSREMDADSLLDMLAQQGIEPTTYVEEVLDNIETITGMSL